MAFSDFKTVPEVLEQFQIRYTRNDFVNGEPLTPSEQFLQELAFNQQYFDIFASEAIRCQAFIFPVLRENYKRYAEDYVLWVEKPIAYDEILAGTPDYLIATKSELGTPVFGKPLIMLVEAKKNDFDMGWGQCLAELVAAQKINDDTDFPVYGIVTDGERWQFGCLLGDTFTHNITGFNMDNLPALFGALDTVFKAATEAARK